MVRTVCQFYQRYLGFLSFNGLSNKYTGFPVKLNLENEWYWSEAIFVEVNQLYHIFFIIVPTAFGGFWPYMISSSILFYLLRIIFLSFLPPSLWSFDSSFPFWFSIQDSLITLISFMNTCPSLLSPIIFLYFESYLFLHPLLFLQVQISLVFWSY